MDKQASLMHIKKLGNNISCADYVAIIPCFFIGKLLRFRCIVMNLPNEIQYPYLFCFYKGINFIKFAESLKKLLHIGLYWENSLLHTKGLYSKLTTSWDFIPEDIDLMINLDILKRKKQELKKIYETRKNQIKLICLNNHSKYISKNLFLL